MHYHLKPGGVTTCLKQQVHALKNHCDVLVLTGDKPDGAFPAGRFAIFGEKYSRRVYAGITHL